MTLAVTLKGRISPTFSLDVAFELPARGVTAVLGGSGAGKTRLLRAVAGLDRLDGQVTMDDECWQDVARFMPTHRRSLGYVFQGISLLPHLSVRGNLAYASRRSRRAGVPLDEISALADIANLLDRMPARLSGGEAQRCAIACALIGRPRLLLMDEPLAALDAESANALLDRLQIVFERSCVPVLYVTHDRSEAERLATSSITLRGGGVEAIEIRSDQPQ